MTTKKFKVIENYLYDCMNDPAHDHQHIYRVLTQAVKIARNYTLNDEVLITACLLHDIGRDRQFHDPSLCHAIEGGEMAYEFLLEQEWPESFAAHVRDCIQSHRFRTTMPCKSIEAKILFDCDKLEAAGALGITRTLLYKGQVGEPIYTVDENSVIEYGEKGHRESFYKEYRQKLSGIYDRFYTKEAQIIANERKNTAVRFFESLVSEIGEIDYLSYCIDQTLAFMKRGDTGSVCMVITRIGGTARLQKINRNYQTHHCSFGGQSGRNNTGESRKIICFY